MKRGHQHHPTASPTPSLDLLSEGYDGCYDTCHKRNGCENHAQVQRKNSDETEQNHNGDEELYIMFSIAQKQAQHHPR